MKASDVLALTIKNITYRKLRSWLTILGVIIGIAAVVGLMGLGDAIQGAINSQLTEFGADKLIISPGISQPTFSRSVSTQGGLGPGQGMLVSNTAGAKNLTENEARAISNLPNVLAVSPMVQRSYNIKFMNQLSKITVQFVDPTETEIIENPDILEGRYLEPSDKYSCVVGYNIANSTFNKQIRTGDLLEVNGKNCKVIGILKKAGGFVSADNYVILNIAVVKSFEPTYQNSLSMIYIKVKDAAKIDNTEALIKTLLKKLHNTLKEDFTIVNFANIMETVQSITGLITAFLGGIATISLLVGAIGISNTMFTSVIERTREIGILKAIGAKRNDILYMFISEAGIMSLIGGLVGILIGIGIASGIIRILSLIFQMPSGGANLVFILNPELMITVLIISLLIGILSGILPARRAASLNPIEAIWYE